MTPESPPAPLPWQHPTLAALAKALGTTTRTLDLWRADGAPIGAEAPHDELSTRLWHAGRIPGKGKVKPLRPADGQVAIYMAHLPPVVVADANTDPAQLVKMRQVAKLDQQIARGDDVMQLTAQGIFRDLLGHLNRELERSLSGGILDDCFTAAQQNRLRAHRSLRRLVKDFVDHLVDHALRRLK